MKKVLVVGGGGRCHAIVDALSRSPLVDTIWCAPGNAGIAHQATCLPIRDTDVDALLDFALTNRPDLTVVGPEATLAAGLTDRFRAAGLAVFGHTKAAARIETSKGFAKEVMQKAGVPTAAYRSFTDYDEALAYIRIRPFPAVLKYDGLAAGKGVIIAQDLAEAEEALRNMLLENVFGEAHIIIEDYLSGPEFSFMCFVNGTSVWPMPLAQDHKRAYDGDKGPNTGGMGAYTALPFITPEDERFALERILKPVAEEMDRAGTPLTGVLYGGLMKTRDGIKVIEFNSRFGDPETEVVLPLLESDAYDIMEAVATGREPEPIRWSSDATLGVVLASKGYPGHYKKGAPIFCTSSLEGVKVFQMGTRMEGGTLVTNGGRVLMVVGRGTSLPAIRERVYAEIDKIVCDNLFYRNDIAYMAMDKPLK